MKELFQDETYPERGAQLKYDDVTCVLSGCRNKNTKNFEVIRVTALTTSNAYREAVYEKLVGQFSLAELANDLRRQNKAISSEADLLNQVVSALMRLKEHVEGKRWIDPFWDGSPKASETRNRDKRSLSAPKSEPRIQPTIQIILLELLGPLGIHILRESNVGTGLIDFTCTYTTTDRRKLAVGIEIKLAHHKELKKGLHSQLPAYLRSIESGHGVFLVMWFKSISKNGFSLPANRSLEEMTSWLNYESEQSKKLKGFVIEPITIDASYRPSASICKSKGSG